MSSLNVFMCFIILSASSFINAIPVKNVLDSTKVAQCRANCLDMHATYSPNGFKALYSCSHDRNCFMCWETCELLYQNSQVWGSMCNEPHLCFPGCQTACHFHKEGYQGDASLRSQHKWIFPSQLIFKEIIEDGLRVDWNMPVSIKPVETDHILYIVMISNHMNDIARNWIEVIQTTDLNTTIPSSLLEDWNDVRVVAVTSAGILAKKSSIYTRNSHIVHDGAASSNVDDVIYGEKPESWSASVLSMDYDEQHHFVETTITWPALHGYGKVKYEVTWKVKHNSMEITGHLYTEKNVVALSLWPDALCEVQIRCINPKEEDIISEVLNVDTNGMITPTVKPVVETCEGCVHMEAFAGFVAGLSFIVLVILIVSIIRCISSRKQTKPMEMDIENKLCRKDAIRRKITKVKVNDITGSISEMVSDKQFRESLNSAITKVCGRALPTYKLSGPGSPLGESSLELLEADDEVFPEVHNTPIAEPWRPEHAHY